MPADFPILVINSGSSSLKLSILDPGKETVLASGIAEQLFTDETSLKIVDPEGVHHRSIPHADHRGALLAAMDLLNTSGKLEIKAIGHRIVHGGEKFEEPVLITDEVLRTIEALAEIAPLHNPPGAQGIRVAKELFADKQQVAVFDTAFHQTLPDYAFHYAIPYRFYEKYRVRRYGFHGTSHQYVALQAAKRIGKPIEETQFVSAHLGNGCSAAAIRGGKSMDTTMGLTPLEGLVMGTRSGDIDPSFHLFVQDREGCSLSDITDILTRKSGLLGVSGVSHDMRNVLAAADGGNERARLAVNLFCYRLARSILGLTAALSDLDAIIFTGGIGENSPVIRAKVLSHLGILRPALDQALNESHGKGANGQITRASSLCCLVIPTNEELMIALETFRLTA